MAFTVQDITLQSKHGLATLTMHEIQGDQNRVIHVVVPSPSPSRLTPAGLKKQARAAAKAALQAAAAAL
jgi:hypothetical protein